MIARKIFQRSLLVSFVASQFLLAGIILLLWVSTELGTSHLVKAVPTVLFLEIFVSTLESVFFWSWLKETRVFDSLTGGEQGNEEIPQQALMAQEELVKYPLRAAMLVFTLWFLSGLMLFSLLFKWGETFFFWEVIFVCVITVLAGAVNLVFHFYFLRKIVRSHAQKILEFETGYHLSQAEVGIFSLRRKMRLTFLPVILAGVAVLTVLAFFQSAIIIRKTYERDLIKIKNNFVDSKQSLEDLSKQNDALVPLIGVNMFLVDEDGNDPLSGAPMQLSEDQNDSHNFIKELKKLREETFTYRYNSKILLILTSLGDVNGKKVFVSMVYDWDKFLGLEYRMLAIMCVVIVLVSLLAWRILILMSDDLVAPLTQMMDQTERVSSGDLSVDFNIISNDELGVLAGRQKAMVLNLRELIERVRNSYDQVRNVINEIMASSDNVAQGTEEQTSAINDTSRNIGEVNLAIKEVSDNTEVLHGSGQETMQRSEEMIRLVEDVGGSLEELGKSVDVNSSSIQEMSVAIKQVASNVEELNKRSAETSKAVMEMQKSIGQVADSSRQSREISELMRKSAEQGVKAVHETIQGISTIEDTVNQARSTLENLGKSTDQIGKILKVIREVANRTNLLALNAAIIAAQAGEQGQGFAVVADEIKNLADRVASSTIEIDQIIKKVQEDTVSVIAVMEKSFTQVETGVNLSYEAGMALERIVKSVEQSFNMAGQISSTTDQQVESANRAFEEITSIADLIQQIAVSTREQSKGADQMAKAGTDIKKFTDRVLTRSRKQIDEAQKVQVAMENVEQMIKFILDSQRGQRQASERIVAAIGKVNNIALRNAHSVGELDKNIAILNQQSEVLKGVLKHFRIGVAEEPGEENL